MAEPIIRVENLSKLYRLGKKEERAGTLAHALREFASAPLRNFRRLRSLTHFEDEASAKDILWALRDVSFEVEQGEVVGLIGRNGAGKSTLLKILSRIITPSRGRVEIHGRLASLLEVGTGFHGELSGRDNIFLNGAVLGMSRKEIARKFDEIVAFSEIERFLDTPVKRYSSGMYVRLAFAVAAHLDSDILILDEVLAVGDAAFQKKCLGKMNAAAVSGRTILFVSHSMQSISALCTRTILLEQGSCKIIGKTSDAVTHYLAQGEQDIVLKWSGDVGNEDGRLLATWIKPKDPGGIFHTAAELEVVVRVRLLRATKGLILGFRIVSEFDTVLAYTLFDDALDLAESDSKSYGPGEIEKVFIIPRDFLGEGRYQIRIAFAIHNRHSILSGDEGNLRFAVANIQGLGRAHLGASGKGFQSILRPRFQILP